LTQEKIGEKMGWSEAQIKNYSMLANKIVPQCLEICKTLQCGLGTKKVPSVAFDFTEGWFRTSGLYGLNEKYQLECIQRFINDKSRWSKTLLQKEIGEKIGWLQQQISFYYQIMSKITTEVLDLCKEHQIGRVVEKPTTVGFDFNEWWFRDSGLYHLSENSFNN